jgi:hypothetical protein
MTFALVVHESASGSTSNGITSAAINTTGADLIVVIAAESGSNGALSDSKSNTWVQLARQTDSFGRSCTFYYAWNAIVGTGHTFTIGGTSNFPSLLIAAYSGSRTSSNPYDTPHLTQASQSSGNTFQIGSVTPGANNELVVSGVHAGGTVAMTIDSSFTITDQVADGNFGHESGGQAYLIQTTAAATNPTWTQTSGAFWNGITAAFIPAPTGVSGSAALTASALITVFGGQFQTSSPIADTSNAGNWVQDDGVTTTNLYTRINESLPNDANFVQSPLSPTGSVYVTRLQNVGVPMSGPITLASRMRSSGATGSLNVTVDLMQGASIIQTFTHTALPSPAWTTFNDVVTNPITNWAIPFDVRFTAVQTA